MLKPPNELGSPIGHGYGGRPPAEGHGYLLQKIAERVSAAIEDVALGRN
jgi:hypothetical protein